MTSSAVLVGHAGNDDDSLFRSVEEDEPMAAPTTSTTATTSTTLTTLTTLTTTDDDFALHAAEREWLQQRVRVVWASSGAAVSVVRRGTATRVFWLSDRSALVASVLYDDGDTVDAEALVDLLHDDDHDDGDHRDDHADSALGLADQSRPLPLPLPLVSAVARCNVCDQPFATAELWNLHCMFGQCKAPHNVLASPVVNENDPIDIDSGAGDAIRLTDKRSSAVGTVLDSLIARLAAAHAAGDLLPPALLDDAYAALEAPSVSPLLQQLLELVRAVVATSRADDSWSQRSFVGAGTAGPPTLPLVRQGLQAARIMARLAVLPELPVGWLSEDAFETMLDFARAVFVKSIVPLFDGATEALQKQNVKLGLSGDEELGRPKSTQWARAGVELVTQLLVLLAHVLKHAVAYVEQRHMSDVLLLSLTSFAHATLFVDQGGNAARVAAALELLQQAAVQTLRTVFRRHALHRAAILDDLFLSLARLPKGKKLTRSWRVLVHVPGRAPVADAVQMTSALVVHLLQSCAAVRTDDEPAAKNGQSAAGSEAAEPEPEPAEAKRGKAKKPTNRDFDPVVPPAKKGKAKKPTAAQVAEAEAAAAAAEIAQELESSAAATKQLKAAPDTPETPGQMARYFLAPLVARCAQAKDDAGYKSALENLVRDLLVLWPLVEWPGAETALLALTRLLMRAVASSGEAGGEAGETVASTPQLRELGLVLLGQIGARVQEVQVGASATLSLGHAGATCWCAEPNKPATNVACTVCSAVAHVSCLDGARPVVDTNDWRCDACTARAAFLDLRASTRPAAVAVAATAPAPKKGKRKAASASSDAVSEAAAAAPSDELVAKKLVLNWFGAQYVAAREAGEAGDVLLDAQRALLSRWHARARTAGDEEAAEVLQRHVVGAKPESAALVFGDAETRRVARELLLEHGALSNLFPLLLRAMLQVLSESSKAVRARALKALSAIADANPAILLDGAARKAVSDRCLDTATSVRESALTLIGKYMLQGNDELVRQFLPVVLERARDTGVSVRKSVIALLRELCLRAPGHARVVQICRAMVQRINDVPTVSAAILRTFEVLWFAPLADGGGGGGASLAQRCDQIAAVCAMSAASSDWLVNLMVKLLDAPVPATAAAARDICTQLVALLAKRVVDYDEARSASGADDASDAQFVGALAALAMFVRARPSLALPHVGALAHYLRVPNVRVDAADARAVATRRTDIAAALRVTALFEQCAPLLAECDAQFLARIEADLSASISSQGLAMVESSVSCLGKLVTHVTHNRALMVDLLSKCVKFVEQRRPGKPPKPIEARDKPMLLRCLCVMGLLVQHFDFDGDAAHDFGDAAVAAAAASRGDRNVTHAFELLRAFVPDTVADDEVRVRAVRSLGAVLARRPALLLDKAIAWLLRVDEPSWKVTEAMLDGLHELLRLQQLAYATPLEPLPDVDDASAEIASDDDAATASAALPAEGAAAAADKAGGSAFVSMHDTTDTSVVSTQMQLAMPSVLAHFGHAHDEVRHQALRLTTMATRMGIINPLLCVPASLALLADANDELAKPALALLAYVHAKHPNMLHLRLVDGVRGAYQQQRARLLAARAQQRLTKREATIAGAVRAVHPATHEAKFARLYQLLEANRRQREAFVSGVIAQLELDSRHERIDVPYVAFLCELLASLPYRALPEVLEVVCVAHRVVSLQGSGVVRLCERQLASGGGGEVQSACNAAAALSMLVYLKRFLKRAWGLGAEQLREHVSLAATRGASKTAPVRRHEAEQLGNAPGFADVLLESGGDVERMKAQADTLAKLMEEELDDHFDVGGGDNDEDGDDEENGGGGGGDAAARRKRGRPRKDAPKKKKAKATVDEASAELLDDEPPADDD